MRTLLKWSAAAVTLGGICILVCLAAQPGTLKIKADGIAATTMAMTNGQSCAFSAPDFSAQLPAGSYKPRVLWVFATEDVKQTDGTVKRVRWDIASGGPWGDLAKINVKENAATEVKLGPPFILKGESVQDDGIVAISLGVLGQAGETYGPSVVRGGDSTPAPGFDIVSKDGKVLTSGSFEYG